VLVATVEFKPRLERILADVVLISEIATLAEQADKVEEPELEEENPPSSWDLIAQLKQPKKKSLQDFLWSPEVADGTPSLEEGTDEMEDSDNSFSQPPEKGTKFVESVMGGYGEAFTSAAVAADTAQPLSRAGRMATLLRKTDSGRLRIKDMLDPWVEPEIKGDKVRSRKGYMQGLSPIFCATLLTLTIFVRSFSVQVHGDFYP